MTLTLTADREARLRSVADLRGLDPETALTALIDQALADAEAEAEAIRADLRASMEDFAAGRSMTVEELRARLKARRQQYARNGAQAETRA